MYIDLYLFADVDIIVIAINASTAIRLLYVNTKEVFQPGRLLPEVTERAGKGRAESTVLQTQIEPVDTGDQRDRGSMEQPRVDVKSREQLGIETIRLRNSLNNHVTRILDKIIYIESSSTRVLETSRAGPAQCSSWRIPQIPSIPQLPPRLAPNLASNAVPRFQPLQAVATCSPHLVRSPRPLWCNVNG